MQMSSTQQYYMTSVTWPLWDRWKSRACRLLQGHVGEIVIFLSNKLPWPHNLSISVIPLRNGQEMNSSPLTAGGMWLRTCLSHTHEAPVAGNLRWRSGVTVNKTLFVFVFWMQSKCTLSTIISSGKEENRTLLDAKKLKQQQQTPSRVSAPLHCSIRLLMGILHLQYLCHFYKCMPLQMYFYTLRFTSGFLLFIRRVKSLFNSLTLNRHESCGL